MKLINIYALSEDSSKVAVFLYEMLRQRDPSVNISHREMPSFEKHSRFIGSMPYAAWYIIDVGGSWGGQIYVTRQNEIGIHICPQHQGRGVGEWAVRELMARHGKHRYLANIAPTNPGSIDFFKGLGFRLIQYTFELETENHIRDKSRYDTGVTPKDTDTPLQSAYRSGGVLWGQNET